MPGYNSIGWFEIGTDDPAAAERFYGDVFGWAVARDDTASPDPAYQFLTPGDPAGLRGGLFATEGKLPGYAIFTVLVEDVAATCEQVWKAGGRVQRGPEATPAGVTFAYLLDPAGNQVGVFAPPPGGQPSES
jgi:predicted enzyme related to lactoylglutathione lyase